MATTQEPIQETTTQQQTIGEWFMTHEWIYAVIGGVALVIVVLLSILVCCYCYCYRRRKNRRPDEAERSLLGQDERGYGTDSPTNTDFPSNTREPSVVEDMNRRRRQQEQSDRDNAKESVEYFVRSHYKQVDVIPLPDMGSRMQKYWFKVSPIARGEEEHLVTIAPVSQRCPVKLDSSTETAINKLMRALQDHPYLHRIEGVYYRAEGTQLVISQPLIPRGSLKDVIYRATPTSDWSQKYSRRSKGLSADKVALYGRHVLEAMRFLYEKGFPPLGHVQSGNCFIEENRCQLSGYENTILGYKTRLYRQLKDNMDKVDIVMFGHLVFEMTCGYELTGLVPSDADYRCVGARIVKEVLQFIFESGFPHDINAIMEHNFFQEVDLQQPPHYEDVAFPSDVKSLMKAVGKGKAVSKQPTKTKKSKTPLMPPANKKTKNPGLEEAQDEPEQKPTPTPRKKK